MYNSVTGVSDNWGREGAGAQKDTDPDNHKGYIPQSLEKHIATMMSNKLVCYLQKAWLANALTTDEYRDALKALEDISGVKWS